jgi:hypothetical protein
MNCDGKFHAASLHKEKNRSILNTATKNIEWDKNVSNHLGPSKSRKQKACRAA